MKPQKIFSEADRARIAEAVRGAETRTSGEIVPYIVGRSDTYPEAAWRAGAVLSFTVLFALGVVDLGTPVWLGLRVAELSAVAIAAFGIGMLAAFALPRLGLLFVSHDLVRRRVDERAAIAFLGEEVFVTRERTGILLFVSLLERRVCVLGDAGINAKVAREEWDGIVDTVVRGMKTGAAAEGLVRAVESCGTLLETHGVAIRADDTNELDNRVRMSDR
jgi:putative membrane protein